MYLSHFIDASTPAYGGHSDLIAITELNSIKNGDTCNSKKISFVNHIGTHIDFPRHFDDYGKTLSDYCSDFWKFDKIGFVESDVEDLINKLENVPSNIEILVLKTGFGQYRGSNKYWMYQPVIPSWYAKLLREKFPNLRVFGFDLISLTSIVDRAEGKKAHQCFLIDYDILVLEDMNLVNLTKCPENIIVAPLLISDIDGVQCTVLSF